MFIFKGAEDDDWTLRMFNKRLCIFRPLMNISVDPYLMLDHSKSIENKDRFKLLSTSLVNQNNDGLSNINNLTKIVSVTLYQTFTHLKIEIGN